MEQLLLIVLYTALAGAALPAGGAIASIERIRPYWLEQELRHGVLAFGGGILLAAVALVLVPEGLRMLSAFAALPCFILGGCVFMLVDRATVRSGTPVSNLLAALSDFLPEAVALGALIASESRLGALLALFIGLQNVPEGFNAYREMVAGGRLEPRTTLLALSGAVALGPVCGLIGLWLLSDAPRATGATMMFAAGGILYLTFQDIAPEAKLSRHWGPPLGAVLGFATGLLGTSLLGR